MTMKPFYGHQNTFVSTLPNETFPHPPFLQSCESGNSRTNIFGPHIFCFHSVTLSFSCYCARLEIVSENMKVSTFEFESHAVPYGVYHCEEILAQWSLLNGHWQRQWPGQNWFYRCHLKNIYRHLNFLSKCSLIPHNFKNIFCQNIIYCRPPQLIYGRPPNYSSFQVKCLKPNFARLTSENIIYYTLFHDHHHHRHLHLHDNEWCQMCHSKSAGTKEKIPLM